MKRLIFSGVLATLLLLVLFSIFYFTEQKLREKGIRPGYLEIDNFRMVDSLFMIPRMLCGEDAVYKTNPEYFNSTNPVNDPVRVNSFGFRSPEFLKKEERDSTIPCIGLIGDSFTWGASAKPLTESYADILRRQSGYYVNNLGIEGADLHEYFLAARWYVPMFKPDIVYVILSCGDFTYTVREIIPFHPRYYYTNAGMLSAVNYDPPFQEFMTPQESYEFYVNKFTLVGKERNWVVRLMGKTAIGTKIWKIFFWKPFFADYTGYKPMSWWYFDKIDSICKANGATFQLIVIPCEDHAEADDPLSCYSSDCKEHFRNRPFLIPDLKKTDYVDGLDTHTNNSGHYKIYELLRSNADSLLKTKAEFGYLSKSKSVSDTLAN